MNVIVATRVLLVFGLILAIGSLIIAPGLGAAAATVAYIGWSRESALRVATRLRLQHAALELEREATRYAALLAILDQAVIHKVEYKVEYKVAASAGTVH